MDVNKYSTCTSYDSRFGILLRRNGSHKERTQYDDDVDDHYRNRKYPLGYLRIRISVWSFF